MKNKELKSKVRTKKNIYLKYHYIINQNILTLQI